MRLLRRSLCRPVVLGVLVAAAVAAPRWAAAQDPGGAPTASYAVDVEVKLSSDQRTRGVSDSLNRPGAKLSVQAAHESGFIGLLELATVSKKQFLDGRGVGVTVAGGYRFGDPEGWHYGAGLAAERFPSASFEAPHGFDLATFTPTDFRRTTYNSAFAVLEVGYGATEGRVLNVISKTYRGADTGGVCGTLLSLEADPTRGLECYARGDHDSRGSWLFDLDHTVQLDPATTLKLHAGYQKIRHFEEANFSDYRIGLTHTRWSFQWTVEWMTTHTRARALYLAQDGDTWKSTDDNRFVVSVSRKF